MSYLPLYVMVAETLKGRILSNDYKAGDLLPASQELANEFDVSNMTIRKALEKLKYEGLIVSRQGYGTIVSKQEKPRVEIKLSGNFREWLESASGRLPQLEVKVLDLAKVIPPNDIRELFGLESSELIWKMKRLRCHNGEPISYFLNYYLPEICNKVIFNEMYQKSFVEVYQEACNIKLTHMEQSIESITADMKMSKILNVEYSSPLFFVENIYFSNENMHFVTHMYYRGDRYIYKSRIQLNE